jgi:hypothetical protein
MVQRKLPLISPFGPGEVFAAAQQAVTQALKPRRTAALGALLGASAGHWAEQVTGQVRERIAPVSPVACREGCAFCCHLKVLVTAPEVLRLAEHIRSTRTPEELRTVRARVARADEVTRDMTTDERAGIKVSCPLLVDGICEAYEARPLACRGANSLDPIACQRAYEHPDEIIDIPVYKPELQVTEAVRAGLASGAAVNGLDGRLFELNAALNIALDTPNAGEAWAHGRPVLDGALDAEFEAMVRHMREGQEPRR